MSLETTEGYSVNGDDDHWIVNCPKCDKEFEYKGYFDPSDQTKCKCGCLFTTSKVWINENRYIE